MKKIASILLFAFLLNGCDDGDISVDLINFEDTTTLNCPTDETITSTLIFKLKEKESLLLYVPKNIFAGDPNPVPKFYDINLTDHRVIYRAYNGKIEQNNICAVIPPATPTVIEEWIATSGVISVLTAPEIDTKDEINNSTRIIAYNYNITFKNITFDKPGGPQTYETFSFGGYRIPVSPANLAQPFLATNAGQCTELKQVYNFNAGESITIDNIDPSLIVNEVTLPDAPRTGLINDTTNKVIYRTYKGGVLTKDFFCKIIPPTTPSVTQFWAGINGVAGESGIIEVTTTNIGNTGFLHTITLKKVSLQKGTNVFKLGDTYVLGQITTSSI
ncbi:hypothetical protein [Flavobacterium sp. PL02]|jgi:hypothetical protein|uniref:hypothetical protein n=1 Tax=Flavobacterium sp. PL02 TaxID=3088354 RepID=UPI002B22F449|nr:hypothetical protein [Flavobacterium sp. PL02]MEA9412141.1 hypothetical protein [Flavobacterium sp. PL02]